MQSDSPLSSNGAVRDRFHRWNPSLLPRHLQKAFNSPADHIDVMLRYALHRAVNK